MRIDHVCHAAAAVTARDARRALDRAEQAQAVSRQRAVSEKQKVLTCSRTYLVRVRDKVAKADMHLRPHLFAAAATTTAAPAAAASAAAPAAFALAAFALAAFAP